VICLGFVWSIRGALGPAHSGCIIMGWFFESLFIYYFNADIGLLFDRKINLNPGNVERMTRKCVWLSSHFSEKRSSVVRAVGIGCVMGLTLTWRLACGRWFRRWHCGQRCQHSQMILLTQGRNIMVSLWYGLYYLEIFGSVVNLANLALV